MIYGEHGVGKSKSMKKALKKRGFKVKKLKLKKLKLEDILGFPVIVTEK